MQQLEKRAAAATTTAHWPIVVSKCLFDDSCQNGNSSQVHNADALLFLVVHGVVVTTSSVPIWFTNASIFEDYEEILSLVI